ncbi:MAG: DNA gyrase subunit A [Anaerolineales bacterium]|nr:DNA gyrase subunit A [Anaerolineales bacterium]
MEIGLVRKINIDEEMQQAYLDYAMSTIVSRALPDARDGLKPVHRRILYAMYDMGLRPNTSYKKSARVVGEVLGKYHPHSDAAVYDAMARMVQDFSMRYPLVDGQGNFGSVDGDPPAAMRYTEAKLAATAMDIMADIQKDTVDFTENFDASLTEPSVLPGTIPNLLVNGAIGIAVGMSTSVPPHNLGEVADAVVYMLENWSKVDQIDVDTLMQFIKGPDFPTGGVILGGLTEDGGLAKAYGSGRGRITVQARAHVEDMTRGRQRIIITELPYMTNKTTLIERIAKLARDSELEGLADLRDESDRQGMRIVIELTKNANTDKVLEQLYKRTQMQTTFSIILLALVDGEPRMLSLKSALLVYINHRLEIIRRRSEFDLARARNRLHILEGLRIALDHLDEVIELIRRSRSAETAHANLKKAYKLSDEQATAILDMPLRRLAALERKKIEDEYKEVLQTIRDLEGLLKSPKKMRSMVAEELLAVRAKYDDRRRTQIIEVAEGAKLTDLLTASDLVEEYTTWVNLDSEGRLSRTPEGKDARLWGSTAADLVLEGNTRDTLYIVSSSGETAAVAMHAIPEAELADQGVSVASISPFRDKVKVNAIFSLPPEALQNEDWYVMTVSKYGLVKKSALSELPGPAAETFELARTKPGDEIKWVLITNGQNEVLMATANGMVIRFSEDTVRPMGLLAAGVNGIKLKGKDEVVGAAVFDERYDVFLLTTEGIAKRVNPDQFPVQGRYGQGVIGWKLAGDVQLAGMAQNKPNFEVGIHLARLAAKRVRLDDAKVRGRPANGNSVIDKLQEKVLLLTVPWETPDGLPGTEKKRKTPDSPPEQPPKEKPAPKTADKPAEQIAMDLDTPAAKTRARKTSTRKAATRKTTTRKPTTRKTTTRKSPVKKTPTRKTRTKKK